MAGSDSKSSKLLTEIIANSLFTPRQVSIISKRLQGGGRPPNMTSGAYYRQVKQCRDKAIAVLYSAILLQSSGALQPEALSAMARLADQLSVIFASEGSSDVFDQARMDDVMSVMDTLVKRVCKL
ncbi:hypothetical protein NTE_00081 [Candidatus Nitrososphaera evergladensis SR1]|uniref:Uncharacterized protein n=2 Tax=Nitrososphaera TaxID=497726 RepID=A0A075MM08_9ARCH|nr:hypothetical protein NTE_00081 [Candidatus Nitrososphaera evergladensis SR1]